MVGIGVHLRFVERLSERECSNSERECGSIPLGKCLQGRRTAGLTFLFRKFYSSTVSSSCLPKKAFDRPLILIYPGRRLPHFHLSYATKR